MSDLGVAGDQVCEQCRRMVVEQPVQHRVRLVGGHERLGERTQLRDEHAGALAEQWRMRSCATQRA